MPRWFFKTQEQKKQEAADRAARELDRKIKREANYYGKLIPDVLARTGVDHLLPRADRPTVAESIILRTETRQKLKIVEITYNEFAIHLWVDSRYMPYRTELADLHTESILETLTDACMRQVVWRNNPGCGAYYIIWRDGAVNAIPAIFKYTDAITMRPENASPLYFIAGVTENNRLIKADLATLPHYLVAGATFMGKSNHLNNVLCQFIANNGPDTLRLLMIDLKGGSEFALYEGLPHLGDTPIVKEAKHVADALMGYQNEMHERINRFAERGIKNLEDWNRQFPDEKLPYYVLVFDELASIMMHPDRKIAKDADMLLYEIMATARASGGHVIICTQRPSSDTIKGYIKVNAPCRTCFFVPSNTDSEVVLDIGLASKINREIKGRAITSLVPGMCEIQSPYLSDNQIKAIIKQAKLGPLEGPAGTVAVTLQDILELSVEQFGGKLEVRPLFDALRDRMTRQELETFLKTLNGGTYTVHGAEYLYKRGSFGRHGGRRLERIGQEPESQDVGQWPPLPKHKIPQGLLKSPLASRKTTDPS